MLILFSMLIMFFISFIILMISSFFMIPMSSMDEAFECGFQSSFFSRVPFSIQFFSTSIIFLLFDVELIVLTPLVLNIMNPYWIYLMMMFIIYLILMMGLLYEWYEGSLDWML